MLGLECDCGNNCFRANRRFDMVQCTECNTRYVWKIDKWEEFKTWKEAKKLARKVIKQFVVDPPKQFLDDQTELIGVWLKKHGITKEKIKKVQETKEILLAKKRDRSAIKFIGLQNKWAKTLSLLTKNGSVVFNKHQHMGKVRGKDIAKLAHRDLQKLGIKTRWHSKGSNGILEWEK